MYGKPFPDKCPDSLYSGILLSQIGEFSFVSAAVGMQSNLVSDYGYQLTVTVIALSIMISPAWIAASYKLLYKQSI